MPLSLLQLPSADRRDYQQRLAREQAAAKKAASRSAGPLGFRPAPVDHYKLLGVERSAATEDVSPVGVSIHWSWGICRLVLALVCVFACAAAHAPCKQAAQLALCCHGSSFPAPSFARCRARPHLSAPLARPLGAGAPRIQEAGPAAAPRQGRHLVPRRDALLRPRHPHLCGCGGAGAAVRTCHLAVQAAGCAGRAGCVLVLAGQSPALPSGGSRIRSLVRKCGAPVLQKPFLALPISNQHNAGTA